MLFQPYNIVGFHSCDKEIAYKVLTGEIELEPSNNVWDWLGKGIYFWEQNPGRALEYAEEVVEKKQKNKAPIKTPFVLGAIIELGNCLNLVDKDGLNLLPKAYTALRKAFAASDQPMPINAEGNRALDCALFNYIHLSNQIQGRPQYDTVRCAFPEDEPAFEGSNISSRLHIQVSVLNPDCIKGYFLPRPLKHFNPGF